LAPTPGTAQLLPTPILSPPRTNAALEVLRYCKQLFTGELECTEERKVFKLSHEDYDIFEETLKNQPALLRHVHHLRCDYNAERSGFVLRMPTSDHRRIVS